MLAAYCRLPRFLKGDRGLFLAPAAVAGGRLEDMVFSLAVMGNGEMSESDLWRTERLSAEEEKRERKAR